MKRKFLALLLYTPTAWASLETTFQNIQDKAIGVVVPFAALLGVMFAAASFFFGNPQAKQHMILAVFGVLIAFAAPQIIDWLRGIVF